MEQIDIENDPFLKMLRILDENGRSDPNVKLFSSVIIGSFNEVKEAMNLYANPEVTDNMIIKYHEKFLEMKCPELLLKFNELKDEIALREKEND